MSINVINSLFSAISDRSVRRKRTAPKVSTSNLLDYLFSRFIYFPLQILIYCSNLFSSLFFHIFAPNTLHILQLFLHIVIFIFSSFFPTSPFRIKQMHLFLPFLDCLLFSSLLWLYFQKNALKKKIPTSFVQLQLRMSGLK